MAVTDLRSWLRRSPQPNRLIVDGKELELGANSRKWVEAEASILAMGGQVVQALLGDPANPSAPAKVLRVTNLDPSMAAELAALEAADPSKPKALPAASSLATEVAQLVLEAGDRGAMRHAEAYKECFALVTSLATSLLQRNAYLEKAWAEEVDRRAPEPDEEGGLEAGIGSMLAQAAAAHVAQPPRPQKPTNGKRGSS